MRYFASLTPSENAFHPIRNMLLQRPSDPLSRLCKSFFLFSPGPRPPRYSGKSDWAKAGLMCTWKVLFKSNTWEFWTQDAAGCSSPKQTWLVCLPLFYYMHPLSHEAPDNEFRTCPRPATPPPPVVRHEQHKHKCMFVSEAFPFCTISQIIQTVFMCSNCSPGRVFFLCQMRRPWFCSWRLWVEKTLRLFDVCISSFNKYRHLHMWGTPAYLWSTSYSASFDWFHFLLTWRCWRSASHEGVISRLCVFSSDWHLAYQLHGTASPLIVTISGL